MKTTYILIHPRIQGHRNFSSKYLAGTLVPLGPLYIASYLESKNYNVKFIDAEQEQLTEEETVLRVREYVTNSANCYIGISSTSPCFESIVSLANNLKQTLPNLKIIIGGAHVSALPEQALSYDCFDYGVIGEGEITTYELLECLNSNGNIEEVDGIVFQRDNNIVKTKPRKHIKDLDSLPFPARHLLKDIQSYVPPICDFKKLPYTSISTSRGCSGRCTFCSRAVFGNSYRERSAENIFEEIKEVVQKYKIREIFFCDDTFLLNEKRIYRLFELCKQENIKFIWSCLARVDNVTYEFLSFLKDNGCWHIAFGIESGDEKILKDINKQISLENVKKAINWCNKLRIETKGFFIIGHPTDTYESIEKTIKFALSIAFTDIIVAVSVVMPGSEQFKILNSEQNIDNLNCKKFNSLIPIVPPPGISVQELLAKQKEFYRRFYFRPRIILYFLNSLFSPTFFKRLITLFLGLLYVIFPLKND